MELQLDVVQLIE
jgi:ADP-ribosylglycohydrolase